MTEPTNNPAPNGSNVPPGQEGTPPVPPSAPQSQALGAGQDFLTKAEFNDALKEMEKRLYQRGETGLGGTLGRRQVNFEEQIRGELSALKQSIELAKASGVQITSEQELAMRNNAIARAFETPQATPPEGTPNAGQEPVLEENDPVVMDAINLMTEAGVTIEDDDPEVQMIYDGASPRKFLKSVEEAIEAKRKRLGLQVSQPGQQPPAQPHTPTNAGGAGGASNPNYGTIRDIDELEKSIFK